MANCDVTLEFNDYLESLSETTEATRGLRNAGTSTEKGAAVRTVDTVTVPESKIIDGDFNFWSAYTGAVTSSGYASDVWSLNLSGATGSLERVAHATSNSKPYFARLQTTVADNSTGIIYKAQGNFLSGKKTTMFLRLKYVTSAPSDLQIFILADGSTLVGSCSVSSITTSFAWYRCEIDGTGSPGDPVDLYSATYTQINIQNQANETFDLDIDKIRLYTDVTIPDGIPSWLDADEDVLLQQQKVQAYYFVSYNDSLTNGLGRYVKTANDSTFFADHNVRFPSRMVQSPTVTVYSTVTGTANTLRDENVGADVAGTTANAGVQGCEVRGPASLTPGNYYAFHIVADARY